MQEGIHEARGVGKGPGHGREPDAQSGESAPSRSSKAFPLPDPALESRETEEGKGLLHMPYPAAGFVL